MISSDVKSAAIIGAGVSGLAAAKCLTARGITCKVYDRNTSLGGVWAAGYAGFGVQVQKDLYQFPDFPLPDGTADFTPGPEFRSYLESYCNHFGLRDALRLGHRVTSLQLRDKGHAGWVLTVENGDSIDRVETDLVVIATGLYSETPHIPDVPGMDGFKGETLHAYDIADIEMLRDRRVAVIGYGKSATDIAAAAVGVAQDVHLVFRRTHWPVPRKLLGLLPFKWGMLTRLTASLIPPYVRPSPAVRLLHSVGRPLPWLFWRIVELLLRLQGRLDTRIARGETLLPADRVESDAFSEITMVPRPGFVGLIRSGAITAHRTGLERFTETELRLADGDALPVDCVVFGTGWKAGGDFLPEDIRASLGADTDGFYLYRHILHPDVPNLAFIGRASSFMSVTTYALQARWLAEVVSGRVPLPDHDRMLTDIARLRDWKQSWMPTGAARSATLLLHMAHYHDELLRDIGEDPLRKRGLLAPLKEVLVPYTASDFRDVV